MSETVLYLYAVTDSDLADVDVDGIHAVDDAPVCVIREAPVAAVVSAVDAERFSASALHRSLEDITYLEGIARAHNAVVARLADCRPVAPVRLATVFASNENVRALLRTRAQEFVAVLERIRGRCEWAVKAFLNGREATSVTAAATSGVSPGRSYLERRRAERDRHAQCIQEASAEAEHVHERLADLALASRRYPPQDRRLTGYHDEMVLNAAYLLPEGQDTALHRAVDEYRGRLRLQLTGPWAPYSFATLESDR